MSVSQAYSLPAAMFQHGKMATKFNKSDSSAVWYCTTCTVSSENVGEILYEFFMKSGGVARSWNLVLFADHTDLGYGSGNQCTEMIEG